MKLVYILSILYLVVSFLLYKKTDKKVCILASIIYTVGLLFCYNVVIVSIYSFFKIEGSLIVLSLINYLIGSILNIISFKRKKLQEYTFNKGELLAILGIIGIVFLVVCFRFRGFKTISYESSDSTIHYKHAIIFSEELEILNETNSKDIVYNNFDRVLSISYINCGLMINIFSDIPTYLVFIYFDCFCLILSTLLFFITIFNIFDKKKMFYSFILSLIYFLGFPLNNLVFGFCYLGLGVMVVNLLFLTVFNIKNFNKKILFNLIILFIINFTIFFSYYLFMPCVYLALGLYFIYLWKKKKLTFKNLLIYGSVTLVIPFVIGVVYFILPGFINTNNGNIFTYVNLEGYIYNNKITKYFFCLLILIYIIRIFMKKEKINYFNFNFMIINLYVLLFFILYVIDMAGLYYFYKLFYLYWLFAIMFIGILLYKRTYYLYTIFVFIIMVMTFVYVSPYNLFSTFLIKNNIFSWNAMTFLDEKIIFTENELELMKNSVKYEDKCEIDKEFLISGHRFKNNWYYSYSGNVPLYGYQYGRIGQIGDFNITFDFWKSLDEYKCLIYFYEDENVKYEKNEFDILYSNNEGAILMKK